MSKDLRGTVWAVSDSTGLNIGVIFTPELPEIMLKGKVLVSLNAHSLL